MYTEKKKTQQALQIKKTQQALQSLHIFSVLWIWLFIFGDVLFGDRRHEWQTTAVSRLAAVCMKYNKVCATSFGSFLKPLFKNCQILNLHDSGDRQGASTSSPGVDNQDHKSLSSRMASQEAQIPFPYCLFLPFVSFQFLVNERGIRFLSNVYIKLS